jgi:hypothetical protein
VMGQWKLISIHLDIVLISAQDRCTICADCTTAWKSFWAHPMVLLCDVGQVEARFGAFSDSVNLGTTCTTAWKIILGAPDGTPR